MKPPHLVRTALLMGSARWKCLSSRFSLGIAPCFLDIMTTPYGDIFAARISWIMICVTDKAACVSVGRRRAK